jgi:hypothetical protein
MDDWYHYICFVMHHDFHGYYRVTLLKNAQASVPQGQRQAFPRCAADAHLLACALLN